MLASYHRWVYENNISESVITLKTWVIQESEFQTIANETIHGFTCPSADIQTKRYISNYDESRTFFGETGAIRSLQKQILCRLCGANHCIWQCQNYLQKNVPERWNLAKQFRLCYRCLVGGHLGKFCPKSRQCGLNGCQKLHNRLLHKTDNLSPSTGDLSQTRTKFVANAELKECPPDLATLIGDAFTFSMEGKSKIKQTQTAMTYATHSFETTRDKSNSKKKSKFLDSSMSKNRSTSWDSSKSKKKLKSWDSSKFKKLSKSWDCSKSKKMYKSLDSSKSKKIFKYWDSAKSTKRNTFEDSSKSNKSHKSWENSAIITPKFRTRSRFERQLSLPEDDHVRFGELQVGQEKLTRVVRKLCSLQIEL